MRRARVALLVALTALVCGCDDAPPPAPDGDVPFSLPSNPRTADTASDESALDGPIDSARAKSAPAAPAPVAGMRGLRVDGRIDVPERVDGTAAFALRTTRRWVFPDRSRTDVARPELGPAHRTRHQRFGDRLWFLDAGELEPVELTAAERTAVHARAALEHAAVDAAYRAALLWPDGFEWEDTGAGTWSAQIDDAIAGELDLRATPPAEDDRLEIDVLREDELLVHLVGFGRYEHPTRRLPASVSVTTEHDTYTETFERIDPRAFYLDALFAVEPPRTVDEDPGPSTTIYRIARVPERSWRRHAFDAPHTDLDLVLERADRLLATLDLALADGSDAVFELDDRARFTAVLVRLAPGRDAPAGFEAPRPGPALATDVDPHRSGALVEALETLGSASSPASTSPGPPYLLQLGDAWQVVLPLAAD
ncbi:hypothetical protein Pla163_26850 [Planctomycetes bacterium Pla163]|uniref:Lipoprotein n=1 Tax=Rohdeia mirabilis TaxID=2528008 RepID=A0A518D242_9BACT|nr:hypothetical protein Pla163_26850 [Planctomycetes bacterium Pla163]